MTDALYAEAKRIAAAGGDVGKLVAALGPEYSARLRCYMMTLPEAVREATIYGRSHCRPAPGAAAKAARKGP